MRRTDRGRDLTLPLFLPVGWRGRMGEGAGVGGGLVWTGRCLGRWVRGLGFEGMEARVEGESDGWVDEVRG